MQKSTIAIILLGAIISNINAVTAEALGMKNGQGVLIQSVTEDGPADKAGIKGGDVVLAMDSEPMGNVTELRNRIGETAPGTQVELLVLREGKEKKIKVKLGQLTEEVFAARSPGHAEETRLGLQVQDLTPDIARQLGYEGESGVLVSRVAPGSEAAHRGLQSGDLIQEINRQPVESVEDYESALDKVKPGEALLLLVLRNGNTFFTGLRMPAE